MEAAVRAGRRDREHDPAARALGLDAHLLARDGRGEDAADAAAPPNGAGFDGVASVSAPGPIASTWLVAVAVWLSEPVTVSVTV